MTSINTMSPGVRGVAALGIRIAGRMADAVNHGGHGWHGRRDDGGIDERRLDDGEMREGRPSRHGGRVRIRFFRASSYLLALELRALYSPYLQVPRTMRVDQSRRHRAKALGPCRALQGLAGPRQARRRRPGLDRPMRDGRSQDCAARGVRGPRPAVDRPTTAEHAGGPGTPPVPRGPGSQASMVPPARPGTGAQAHAPSVAPPNATARAGARARANARAEALPLRT